MAVDLFIFVIDNEQISFVLDCWFSRPKLLVFGNAFADGGETAKQGRRAGEVVPSAERSVRRVLVGPGDALCTLQWARSAPPEVDNGSMFEGICEKCGQARNSRAVLDF
jgi:hypothetical protein